jgi:cytochrome c553
MGKIASVRRVLILLLVLALPVFTVACGGGTNENTAPETIEGTPPADDATTEDEGGGGGGGGAEGDPAAGKEIFASAGCGNCHAFEDAGTTGSVGPNLDESDIDLEGAVSQIANGGSGMPAYKDQLSEQEIADVAAYVTGG